MPHRTRAATARTDPAAIWEGGSSVAVTVTCGPWAVSSCRSHRQESVMASTPRVPKTEITGLYGWMLKRLSRKHLGEVPEAAGVMWHHRAVLFDSMAFGRKVGKWDQLDPNLTTFAHMAVAALVGCTWCLDFNYFH